MHALDQGQGQISFLFTTLLKIKLSKADVIISTVVLIGFDGLSSRAIGKMSLTISTHPYKLLVNFIVIDELLLITSFDTHGSTV